MSTPIRLEVSDVEPSSVNSEMDVLERIHQRIHPNPHFELANQQKGRHAASNRSRSPLSIGTFATGSFGTRGLAAWVLWPILTIR